MDINIRFVNGVTIVDLTGDLIWKVLPDAQTRILAAVRPHSNVILDMSQTQFISSAGLRLLLIVYRTITSGGGRVLLAGLSEELRNTIALVGLLDFFPQEASVDTALLKLAS